MFRIRVTKEKISWKKLLLNNIVRDNAFHGSVVIASPNAVVFHLFTEEPRFGCSVYYTFPRVRSRLLFEINNVH